MPKILVIEDDELIRENILELLDAEEFEAVGAENGNIGVKLATQNQPDLILCDVMMPELDGYGVLAALRSQPLTATIPFIFLTARADKSDTRKGMELGADDYIPKPCTAEELLNAIAIRLKKQAIINQQAEIKLDELRRNITRSLPHELRTPLNGILGFTEMLISEYDYLEPSEIQEIVERIRASGKRLDRLIVNFLIYAELELLAANPQQVKILRNTLVSSAEAVIGEQTLQQARQEKREADLQLDLKDFAVPMAAVWLNKAVEELTSNAFKFSEPGTPVSIQTSVENNRFMLSVSNKGRGMTPEQIAKLGAYMQFERKIYEQQGSGLGLSIVKQIAKLHSGELKIESIPNQETTVFLFIPL
ncbi:MAG TPA: response regulator [Kamptonema sp.]|nr:response regulator [Kamptonema sp.]